MMVHLNVNAIIRGLSVLNASSSEVSANARKTLSAGDVICASLGILDFLIAGFAVAQPRRLATMKQVNLYETSIFFVFCFF